jgi:predicted neutral ceramidase superfamily lipid hydrolase
MILELADSVRSGFLIAAFLVSVYYWKNYKNSAQKYFPFLMFLATIIEVIANVRLYCGKETSNFLYNVYLIISFVFLLIWFIAILKRKIIPKILLFFFLAATVFSVFTESATEDLYFYVLMTGSVFILVGAFLFFKQLIETDAAVYFIKNQQFWIMSGLLVFYIGFLPFYLLVRNLDLHDYRIGLVIPLLNVLLYGCFIIGFKCPSK